MSHGEKSSTGFQIRTGPLAFGAAMVGAGAIVATAGLVLSGTVVLAATRRWISELEVPPNELAKQKWAQARAATIAGAGAWQNGLGADAHAS
jgi:hypothetical protein